MNINIVCANTAALILYLKVGNFVACLWMAYLRKRVSNVYFRHKFLFYVKKQETFWIYCLSIFLHFIKSK